MKGRLFADDCLLYRVIKTMQDQLILQRDLKSLEHWSLKWGMRFKANASKCYMITICRGKKKDHMYELCNTILKGVTQEKYLGVLITDNLSWSPHIQKVSTAANQKLGFLRRNLKGSPRDLKKLAYITTVRTSLECASVIWDPHQQGHRQLMEKSQRKAARWIANDYDRTSSVTAMLANLEPLEERRRILRLTL